MSAWPSLLVLPLVAPDGIVVNDAQGNTGTIGGLYRHQLRVPLLIDHDNPNAVGEVIYVERDVDGSYWCLAGTSLRALDWRQRASLAADTHQHARDHRQLVLDHIALVEHGACAAGPVRLTTQKTRPPGRPSGWSDRDWGRLQRGWQSHQRHGRDELLSVVDRRGESTRLTSLRPKPLARPGSIRPGRPLPVPSLTPRQEAIWARCGGYFTPTEMAEFDQAAMPRQPARARTSLLR